MPSAGVERGGGAALGGDIAHVSGRGISLRKNRENLAAPAVSKAAPRRIADHAGATFAKARNAGTLKTSKQFSDFVGAGDSTDFYKFK
jgi:hypothetical protein